MTTVRDADETQKLWKIAKDTRVAVLTLQDAGGGMNARPMRSLIADDDESIWFVTDRNSPKMSETREGGHALLTYANVGSGEYVVFRGRISVVDDREKLKSLWTKGDELFFPEGPEQSSAILLRFDPADAEYWTGGSSTVKFAVEYVKMKLTGARASLGEHRRVDL
jgi:general stress protein 26